MRRIAPIALLFLLAIALVPLGAPAHGQGGVKVDVRSTYTLHRYGYATINESVTMVNNGTSAAQAPTLTFGFGNISADIVSFSFEGGGFTGSQGAGMSYTVTGPSIEAGGNATFLLSALANGVVSTAADGTPQVLTLSSPAVGASVDRLVNVVSMPSGTSFTVPPLGLTPDFSGTNNTYYSIEKGVTPQSAVTSQRALAASSGQDFNPLRVYSVQTMVGASSSGTPQVTERISFQNLGTTQLGSFHVSLLAPPTTKVTIVTVTSNEPVIIRPFTESLISGYINLASFLSGYPGNGVPPGTNFTLTYSYPLGGSYYSVSGDKVTVNIPEAMPVDAFADSYSIGMALPHGARAVQNQTVALDNVTPWQNGTATFSYALSLGWAADAGVPVASVAFVVLLLGLFAAGSAITASEEEEEAEGSSSEKASAMITAFDEKTNLINGFWAEIDAKDPNELDKKYFDTLRGRLDTFRSRALQRLNEVKQKSTSQRFFDVVNQIQVTEREVDRAAKDKLNLYQQYHLRQMRKEVYDRLLPQYTKRLERALNQLSDELHTVQREAKLL